MAPEVSIEPLESADGSDPLLVQLATLPTTALPACMHTLLEIVFFAATEPQFLSVTVTDGTSVSFVAEPDIVSRLKTAVPTLNVDERSWSVVRVDQGASGFTSIGVVERCTEPLADAGIPVLYVSTYSTDYCLLPRARLDDALQCLAPSPGAPQRGAATPPRWHAEEPVAPPATDLSAADAAAAALEGVAFDADGSLPTTTRHPLAVLDGAPSHIVRLEKRHRQRHTGALLRLLFMPQPGDRAPAIASLTETADEISLMASSYCQWWASHVQREGVENGLQHEGQEWVPIRVGGADGTPIEEVGVIATQAKVLADADISILYLSTFYSDFTLVQRADVERAAQAFERAGFELERIR